MNAEMNESHTPSSDEWERRLLFETSAGERVWVEDTSILVSLPPGRCALTTSWVNGGFQKDIDAIFNHKIPHKMSDSHELEGGSIPAYLEIVAHRLGVDPSRSCGLLTAANMRNVSIVTHSFRGLEVTAIVTAGIEINGGRAGDPASYYQEDARCEPIGGTINTILLIGANLPSHAMTRAVMTATEAKAAALQQLMAPSKYSNGIATGSGTDMIAVVTDTTSSLSLTDAGKHSKLGELIGKCVIEATQESLDRQSELSPLSQRDMLVRLERFGIDEARYWKVASTLDGENRKARFLTDLRELSRTPSLVAAEVSLLHLVDEIAWGMIPENAGKHAAFGLMRQLPRILDMPQGRSQMMPVDELLSERESILDNWVKVTAWVAKNLSCTQ
ncbi:MAG: adenosylcobinamide amidohydrolase [Euryarchaeota archaeon]|nr:adenosylcobinamide amidohydrolase [Euryarchaeota archaeon]